MFNESHIYLSCDFGNIKKLNFNKKYFLILTKTNMKLPSYI